MMEFAREWLLGITGAAILTALADSLMPKGGVKQVGRLVCGLILILAVLRPLASAEVTNLLEQWEYDLGQVEQQKKQLQEEADDQMKRIIERQMSAYSMDKAEELGVSCQVQVSCRPDGEGIFLPQSAQVSGVTRQEDRQILLDILKDLGLSASDVSFSGEGAA